MRKKTSLLLFALMLAGVGAQARQRTFSEARAIAERQAESLGISVDAKYMARANGFNLVDSCGLTSPYYVFLNGENKGFTIVSGDDRMPAIIGYSDHGTFSKENVPEAMAAFLDMYSDMEKELVAGDKSAKAAVAEARALREAKSSKAVAPLLGNIKWSQNEPFNNLCPLYDGNNRSVVGCVATAMAQVMAYWKYPKALCADIPAYVTDTYEIPIDEIKKGETYDWDNMLDSYSGDYTSEQAAAAAKLSYHCGAAVGMDYGYTSGASLKSTMLVKYFGYDPDLATDINRDFVTLDEWTSLVDRELEAGRPVLYGGFSSDGGHRFVCDGSDGNGLYHINWGWGGYQDGYFDITILNPEKGGTGSGTAPDGYNREVSMIIGLCPDNGKKDEPLVSLPKIVIKAWDDEDHAVSIGNGTRADANASFSVTMKETFCNYDKSDFTGYVAFGVKNPDGTYMPISEIDKITVRAFENKSVWSTTITDTFDYAFPVGSTAVYGLYSEDGETWKLCGYASSSRRPMKFTATETKLQEDRDSHLSAKLEAEEEPIVGMQTKFGVTLSNNSDEEFIGTVNVYASNSASRPVDPTTNLYVTVPAHSSVKRNISLTPGDTDLYVSLTDGYYGADILDNAHFTAVVEDAPSISLVSAETNAADDVFELNDAYIQDYRVSAPRTEEGSAVFTFGLQNNGGTAVFDYLIAVRSGKYASNYFNCQDEVRVPGGGKITYITHVVEPSEVNDRTILCGLYVPTSDGGYGAPSTTLPNVKIEMLDDAKVFVLTPNLRVVYVGGEPTGVNAVEAEGGLTVNGGKGELLVKLESGEPLAVYAVDGSKVAVVKPVAGGVQHIALRAGVYVVKGRKVVVR